MKGAYLLTCIILSMLISISQFAGNVDAQEASLNLCLGAAADYSPVYPTESFPSTVKGITAVFRLSADESYSKMTSTWIAVDVGRVAPPNYRIAEFDLSLQGRKKGSFRYSQTKPLPVGKYRLEVTADGRPWKSADFRVVSPTKGVQVKHPSDLLPLQLGKIWRYAFVQRVGKGGKFQDPSITPDSEGGYHALVTMSVVGMDDKGFCIQMRRNNEVVTEEWWQSTKGGLVCSQRKTADKLKSLDPPQLLIPWPLKVPLTWNYEARDKSFKQRWSMWGPVKVMGPQGAEPGYVVLVQQPPQYPLMTAERHFIPHVGFVREVIVTALAGKLISRQEMTLKE